MAAVEAEITARIKWRREDGSGEPCVACGEQAWLIQQRLFMAIGDGEHWIPLEIVLCASCSDLSDELGDSL